MSGADSISPKTQAAKSPAPPITRYPEQDSLRLLPSGFTSGRRLILSSAGTHSLLGEYDDPSFVAVAPAPFLPHEIIENILHCLPVKSLCRFKCKSLCRFKCVSKSWLNLISDSTFVKLHLDRAKKESSIGSSDHLMLGIIAGVDKRSSFRSMSMNNLRSIPCTHDKISLPGVLCWIMIGSCDGLVCLINYNNAIILCNPSTGAQLILESCSVYFLVPDVKEGIDPNEAFSSSYGFGYDRTCQDYKVIMVIPGYN